MNIKEFLGREIKTLTKNECVFVIDVYTKAFKNKGLFLNSVQYSQLLAVTLQLINVMEPNLLLFHSQLCETNNPSAQPEPPQDPSPSVDSPSTS